MGKIAPDLTGKRFGKLEVLGRSTAIRGRAAWICRCDCGNHRAVRSDRLQDRRARSCGGKGCRRVKTVDEIHRKTYQSWWAMIDRCSNPKCGAWKNYGGRGIRVCLRWRVFARFLIDMGRKPSPKHTIERDDVNGDYTPTNCRWITKAEQRRNLRNSIYIERDGGFVGLADILAELDATIVGYEGEQMSLMQVAAKLGASREAVHGRLKLGWSVADALLVPIRPRRPNRVRSPDARCPDPSGVGSSPAGGG